MSDRKPYPDYRKGGIDWAPELPAHWGETRLRRIATIYAGGTPDRARPEYWAEGSVPWLNSGSVNDRVITRPSEFITQAATSSTRWAHQGAVLVALAGQGRTKGMSARLEFSSTFNQSMAAIAVHPKSADYRYIHLWLEANYQLIRGMAGGDLRDGLNLEHISSIQVPLPPAHEQAAIATFLDRETTEIDAFIVDQEELIELLAERRAATIGHAVAKGIDATAPLKDSVDGWLGAVPEGWIVTPFARAVKFREGPGIGAADFRDKGIPLLRVAGVRNRYATLDGCNFLDPTMVDRLWRRFKVELGELLVSASASMGTVSEAGPEVVGAIPYTGIIRMSPGKHVDRDFLRFFLQSTVFRAQVDRFKTGSTIQHYGPEHLRQMYVPLPSIATQVTIAAHITEVTAEIDDAMADAHEAIALSRERRTALISAAVTGKIDVRGAA